MKVFAPEYYQQFRCIASACPDSCCKEWAVDVDPEAAAMYRQLPGTLGDRLRQVLQDTEDGTIMTIENGRCPMWRQDGLCRIQAELGHDALCQTCRNFPRLRHDYGDFVELGLELSCPEAARLIFSAKDHRLTGADVPGGEAPEYDEEAMATLRRSREEILDFLDRKDFSLSASLAILLLYGYSVQNELDGGEEAVLAPEACLEEARGYAKPGDIQCVFDFFSKLEILTEQWKTRLSAGPVNFTWNENLRPLLQYGICRYWLQAVSDYDLICRIKFLIAACLLVNALGGDPTETAQLFSKEIENDPDNLEAILDGAYTDPAFTDTNILGLLFSAQ